MRRQPEDAQIVRRRRTASTAINLLPVLFIVLLEIALFVLPDQSGWWDRKSFFVNLASGFVAACFGVWFAYQIIQRLLRDEDEDRSERRRNERYSRASLNSRLALSRLVREDVKILALLQLSVDIRTASEAARPLVDSLEVMKPGRYGELPKEAFIHPGIIPNLSGRLRSVAETAHDLFDLSTPTSWLLVQARWRVLIDVHVSDPPASGSMFSDVVTARTDSFVLNSVGISDLRSLHARGVSEEPLRGYQALMSDDTDEFGGSRLSRDVAPYVEEDLQRLLEVLGRASAFVLELCAAFEGLDMVEDGTITRPLEI